MRAGVAAFVAVAMFVAGSPASAASGDFEKARRRANAAAAELNQALTRLSRVQSRLAEIERRRDETAARIRTLEGSLRRVAVDRFINGSGSPPVDLTFGRDLSAEARAQALASFVASGSDDAVDAYRAAAEDLELEEQQLASTKEQASDAVAAYRARVRAANAELARLQRLEAERIAREKARRAAAARSTPRRGAGVVIGSGSWICPVQGPRAFTNDWGQPRGGGRRRHQGTDILAPRGTPVVASVSGVVSRHESRNGGHSYYLRGSDGITYFGAHLDSYSANAGQVAAGTVLGYVGNTGNARGGPPHLHFEMHPGGGGAVNPYPTVARYC